VKHGLQMQVGMLPKGAEYIRRQLSRFKAALEQEIVRTHGKLTLTTECLAQTATRHEAVACLAHRWLRLADGDLTPTEKLNFAKVIADSSDKRDRVLLRLDLDKDPADFLEALYATPVASSEAGNGDGDGEAVGDGAASQAASEAAEGDET